MTVEEVFYQSNIDISKAIIEAFPKLRLEEKDVAVRKTGHVMTYVAISSGSDFSMNIRFTRSTADRIEIYVDCHDVFSDWLTGEYEYNKDRDLEDVLKDIKEGFEI